MYAPSSYIYGKDYGSGFVYVCRKCGAYVGTHKNSPKCAMGLLADNEMRMLRQELHKLFDRTWENRKERTENYKKLAVLLGVDDKHSHIAWMDKKLLRKAIEILKDDDNWS